MKAIFQCEKYIHDSKEIQNQWFNIFCNVENQNK